MPIYKVQVEVRIEAEDECEAEDEVNYWMKNTIEKIAHLPFKIPKRAVTLERS